MKLTHRISIKVDIELHDMQQALKSIERPRDSTYGESQRDIIIKKAKEFAVLSAVDFAGAFEERHSGSWGDVTVNVHAMEVSQEEADLNCGQVGSSSGSRSNGAARKLTIEVPDDISAGNLRRAENAMLLLDNLMRTQDGLNISNEMIKQAYAAWPGASVELPPMWRMRWEFQDAMETGHRLMQPLIVAMEEKRLSSRTPWSVSRQDLPATADQTHATPLEKGMCPQSQARPSPHKAIIETAKRDEVASVVQKSGVSRNNRCKIVCEDDRAAVHSNVKKG